MTFVLLFVSLFILKINSFASVNTATGLDAPTYAERLKIAGDRVYYIAAVEREHSYAPNATNPFDKLPVDESEQSSTYTKTGIDRIGKVYIKALYREFTDETFTKEIERTKDWKHLSVMGPLIRGKVGERIKIIFFNNCSNTYSMHPHGVKYTKSSEGAKYIDGADYIGDGVPPGQKWVYFWDVRSEAAGSYNELSSKFWMYHSHVNEPADTNAGLVGPMIITKNGQERSNDNLVPKDVDREFVTMFTVMDENLSQYLKANVYKFATNYINKSQNATMTAYNNLIANDDFIESNLMHSMNGLTWGTLGRYYTDIKTGEKVRWYLGAFGTEVDLHSIHWHGHVVFYNNKFVDVTQVIPAITQTVDMIPEQVGTWIYHCHVNDHIEAGMLATYTVINESNALNRTFPINPIIQSQDILQSNINDVYNQLNSKIKQQDTMINNINNNNNDSFDWGNAIKIAALSVGLNIIVLLIIFLFYKMCQKNENNSRKIADDTKKQSLINKKNNEVSEYEHL